MIVKHLGRASFICLRLIHLFYLTGVELCVLHNVDEETFVETWPAYAVTNLNGEAPTEEALAQFERRELSKIKDSVSSVNTRQVTTPLTVYRTPKSNKKNPLFNVNLVIAQKNFKNNYHVMNVIFLAVNLYVAFV